MARSDLQWTQEKVKTKIVNRLVAGWSVIEVARELGISRQRVYKLLSQYEFPSARELQRRRLSTMPPSF